jgi:hypothetical protein
MATAAIAFLLALALEIRDATRTCRLREIAQDS